MKYTLLALLMISAYSLRSQDASFNEITLGLGSGYPGILKLDELVDDSNFEFERKALPPLNIWAEINIARRWVTGLYIGYEYEEKSGTTIGFSGNNQALIIGATIYWYLNRRFSENPAVFNPFIGTLLTYSNIDTNTPIRGFTPSFAVGADVLISKHWLARFKIGYGSAIAELSIGHRIFSD